MVPYFQNNSKTAIFKYHKDRNLRIGENHPIIQKLHPYKLRIPDLKQGYIRMDLFINQQDTSSISRNVLGQLYSAFSGVNTVYFDAVMSERGAI